jgi:S-adenosylmethionine decarboxylase
MEETFGPHITLDLKGCPKEILSNYQLHFDFLKNIPQLIQMTPITQPYVFPYEGLVPEDRGITGIVIIAESHISVHSFEEKGWCFIRWRKKPSSPCNYPQEKLQCIITG